MVLYASNFSIGDDFSIDTNALTGATVISDLDINITTNGEGHVTDANGTVSTRDLTPTDLGLGNVAAFTNLYKRLNIPVRVAIAAWEWGAYLGDDAGSKGVNVCISDWQRISPKSFKPFAKGVGGYMNSTLAKIDAVKQGFDDAIMLSDNGTVAEGSGQNIFIYKNNQLLTPPIETGALGGITRKMVIEIANYLDIPVVEQDLSPADLIASDEIFFTGTATEIVGVVSVDSNKISDGTVGEVTSKIRTKYLEIVNGQDDNFKNYITLI